MNFSSHTYMNVLKSLKLNSSTLCVLMYMNVLQLFCRNEKYVLVFCQNDNNRNYIHYAFCKTLVLHKFVIQ